jgi:general secretion pathway protein A
MYLKRYRLREAPFSITPDPTFLYRSPSHNEALATLTYGVARRKGFISLVGEVGSGKTTVLRAFLEESDPDCVHAVYILNPELSFEDLVSTLVRDLGVTDPPLTFSDAIEELQRLLVEIYERGERVALILDEAQRCSMETLERLRVLSNLETTKDKLLQIVLCGQPELETILARPELRQLRQRIALRARIQLLTKEQSLTYIEHRLTCVSSSALSVFSLRALRAIIRCAKGNPRIINTLCDNALIAGYAAEEMPISAKTVRAVIAEYQNTSRKYLWRHALPRSLAAAAVLALLFLGAGFMEKRGGSFLEAPGHEDPRASGAPTIPVVEAALVPASLDAPPSKHPVIPIDEAMQSGGSLRTNASWEEGLNLPAWLFPENIVPEKQGKQEDANIQEAAPLPHAEPEQDVPDETREPEQVRTATLSITIQKGDSIRGLLLRNCGKADEQTVREVLRLNPHITNVHKIRSGSSLVLPVYTDN